MKKVKNPLTVIGLFAGIAEVAGTVVLPFVNGNLQIIFIWYIIGFPVFLVLLFFVTLNKNPRVLYAPSDFRDEENIIKLLSEASDALTDTIDENPNIEISLRPVENFIEKVAINKIENDVITNVKSNSEMNEMPLATTVYLLCDGHIYRLVNNVNIIGKSKKSDICIDSPVVSRKHCLIYKEDNTYHIKDLESCNGTYVNGKRVFDNFELHNKDMIQIADCKLQFISANIEQ